MEIKELSANGHERLVSCTDGDYHGLIAIHNTHLGPAIGGSRFWQYQNEQEAIVDVLRLARGDLQECWRVCRLAAASRSF